MKYSVGHICKSSLWGVLALGIAQGAHANLVQNGDFETVTSLGTDTTFPSGQLGYNIALTSWTSLQSSYNFVFAPGVADTTGAVGQFNGLGIWGPADGAANGLTASSPAGGNFVAGFGDFATVGPLSQTISGLTVGSTYTLLFDWAAAQQFTFDGPTTAAWIVSLGGQTNETAIVNNTNHGFVPWTQVAMQFTATNTSEVLSFLAYGTGAPSNAGGPPMSLLDHVDLELSAPDAAPTVALLGFSAVALFATYRLRRQHS